MTDRAVHAEKAAQAKAAELLRAAGWLVLAPADQKVFGGPELHAEWANLVAAYPPYARPAYWSDIPYSAQRVWNELAELAANR